MADDDHVLTVEEFETLFALPDSDYEKRVPRWIARVKPAAAVDDQKNNDHDDKTSVETLLQQLRLLSKKNRRYEQVLQSSGIPIPRDIPYDVAKRKIAELTEQIHALTTEGDGSDELEYSKLCQQLDQYTSALMASEEYQQELQQTERAWEESIRAAGQAALAALQRHMPVSVRLCTEAELTEAPYHVPAAMARKFKRTNVLQLIRRSPTDIEKMHPSMLEGYKTTGLTLTEQRALHEHLKPVGNKWKLAAASTKDTMTERKYQWYMSLYQKLQEAVHKWDQHVQEYGTPSSTHKCRLLGNQCPFKADATLDYYSSAKGCGNCPVGPEYEQSDAPAVTPKITTTSSSSSPSSRPSSPERRPRPAAQPSFLGELTKKVVATDTTTSAPRISASDLLKQKQKHESLLKSPKKKVPAPDLLNEISEHKRKEIPPLPNKSGSGSGNTNSNKKEKNNLLKEIKIMKQVMMEHVDKKAVDATSRGGRPSKRASGENASPNRQAQPQQQPPPPKPATNHAPPAVTPPAPVPPTNAVSVAIDKDESENNDDHDTVVSSSSRNRPEKSKKQKQRIKTKNTFEAKVRERPAVLEKHYSRVVSVPAAPAPAPAPAPPAKVVATTGGGGGGSALQAAVDHCQELESTMNKMEEQLNLWMDWMLNAPPNEIISLRKEAKQNQIHAFQSHIQELAVVAEHLVQRSKTVRRSSWECSLAEDFFKLLTVMFQFIKSRMQILDSKDTVVKVRMKELHESLACVHDSNLMRLRELGMDAKTKKRIPTRTLRTVDQMIKAKTNKDSIVSNKTLSNAEWEQLKQKMKEETYKDDTGKEEPRKEEARKEEPRKEEVQKEEPHKEETRKAETQGGGKEIQVAMQHCDLLEDAMDEIDFVMDGWIDQMVEGKDSKLTQEHKQELVTSFRNAARELEPVVVVLSERANWVKRSAIECELAEDLYRLSSIMYGLIRDRMSDLDMEDRVLKRTMQDIHDTMVKVHKKNLENLKQIGVEEPQRTRQIQTVEQIVEHKLKERKKRMKASKQKSSGSTKTAVPQPAAPVPAAAAAEPEPKPEPKPVPEPEPEPEPEPKPVVKEELEMELEIMPRRDQLKWQLMRQVEEAARMQKKLEKTIVNNGLAIPDEKISFTEAEGKIAEISKRMQEIGFKHPEYFKLEQEMEKYSAALMASDEYRRNLEEREKQWEIDVAKQNAIALKKLRRHMPVNIRVMSEAELTTEPTPNGKILPQALVKKFKRSNVLQLIRMNPDDIEKMHFANLEGLSLSQLSLTEMRALYEHVRTIGPRWEKGRKDKKTERKFMWYQLLRNKLKQQLQIYNDHVQEFGPPDRHKCKFAANRCPVHADAEMSYDGDYGFTEKAEYEVLEVAKEDLSYERAKVAAMEAIRDRTEFWNSRSGSFGDF